MSREPDPSFVGRTIGGKFAVEGVIGGGAMGAVYRARQLPLDKLVAIKVMHRDLSRDSSYVARFLREAKAASRIDHPNSVRVIDFGEDQLQGGLLYLAMELLDGQDLYSVLRSEGPLGAARVGDIMMQTLAAVAVAHEMGVVHRDIKPENIVITQGNDDEGRPHDIVKVCDFGVAKITDPRGEKSATGPAITTEGLVVGTPEYMSPEQGRGEVLDARSDLYSIGVILYQMLSGRVPFEAESALGIVLKHVTDEPAPPSIVRAEADPGLEAVCLRAMKKRREDRYQTAREMRAEIRASLESRNILTRHYPTLGGSDPHLKAARAVALQTPTPPPLEPAPRTQVTPTPDLSATTAGRPIDGTADTAVAFDSSAIRALTDKKAPEVEPPPESSPALSESVVPRTRWGGIVAGGALLAVAAVAIGWKLRNVDTTAVSTVSSNSGIATTATASSTNSASSVSPLPTDTLAPLTTTVPVHSASHPSSVVPAHSTHANTAPISSSGPAVSVDPKSAKIGIVAVRALGASPETLKREVPEPKILQCYRASLATATAKPAPTKLTLHVDANEKGVIKKAELSGGAPLAKEATACIVRAMHGRTIAGDDGVLISGDIDLTFSPD